jgi:hypothetical protein
VKVILIEESNESDNDNYSTSDKEDFDDIISVTSDDEVMKEVQNQEVPAIDPTQELATGQQGTFKDSIPTQEEVIAAELQELVREPHQETIDV